MHQKKVALITGASRGIGLAVARELYARGYALSLGVRNPERLREEFGNKDDVLLYRYEARDINSPVEWVSAVMKTFNRIDVVVNSAGICKNITLEDGHPDLLEETMDINVKAPFRLMQATFEALKVSGEGRVINLSSLSGKRVRTLNIGYQMSKHAVMALNHGIRRAGWEFGIRATAVCPGYVSTDMAIGLSSLPAEEMTSAEDLAILIANTIALPNTASIAELLVNCAYEHML
jgi:NAD(P)-dependent dehydrogenase (short-subunit alcohol dehydrogenase family)